MLTFLKVLLFAFMILSFIGLLGESNSEKSGHHVFSLSVSSTLITVILLAETLLPL